MKRKIALLLLSLALLTGLFGCVAGESLFPQGESAIEYEPETPTQSESQGIAYEEEDVRPPVFCEPTPESIDEDGSYDQKDDVALYIKTYGRLPGNYITKSEARNLGWEGGSVEQYAPGMCIGGDRFGNYEGLLPDGADYLECDIDTLGKNSRGAKRIVFSSEEAIYYTDDHYESFTQLFPGE